MRIEQRIGRIDRYGQQSPTIAIVNLITPGTVDADIYERCLLRIGVFQHAIGGNEEILGTITKELRDIAESFDLSGDQRAERLQQLADNAIRQVREEEELEAKQKEFFGLSVPNKAWRDEIKAFETFWLSPTALQGSVTTYLRFRIGTDLDHLLGDRSLKTLRLSQDARRTLLQDYKQLPRSTDPEARQWEKWLKGTQPTISVTFEQETAATNTKAVYLSVLHPLVRQAARFLEVTEPKHCVLAVVNDDVPEGRYYFALYRWSKRGIKPDEALVPVALDVRWENRLLTLLQFAKDDPSGTPPNSDTCDALDSRHHAKWAEARTQHIAENRQLIEHRIQSLTVSHRSRCKVIEEQIMRATNEKIRLMKESELGRANTDFTQRLEELKEAAETGDIRATAVVFGALLVANRDAK
jgi:hypothetical protein